MSDKNTSSRLEALPDSTAEQISGGKYNGAVFMYTVQPGETLSMLAHRFGTTVRVLRELNGITDPSQFRAGRTIMIPQR